MSQNSLTASKRFASQFLKATLVVAIAFASGCGGSNLFKTFAATDSDESLYRTVLDSLNDGNYQNAIDACDLMSPSMATSSRGLYVCANAYAGQCGYTLFTVVNQYEAYAGTPLLFEYFMEQNNGATNAKITACGTALSKIRSIGSASARSSDQNYLAILSGLTHAGVILNTLADTDDDATPDPSWDSCNNTDFPDATARQFGQALWEMYRSSEATQSTLTDPIKTALDAVSTGIDAVDTTYNFLKATADPSAFTANEVKGVRTLVKEGMALGLDYCANFAVCKCP